MSKSTMNLRSLAPEGSDESGAVRAFATTDVEPTDAAASVVAPAAALKKDLRFMVIVNLCRSPVFLTLLE